MRFLRASLSGIHHIYIYDTYNATNAEEECLESYIDNLNISSRVTYHDWSGFNKGHKLNATKYRAYNHALIAYKQRADWQVNLQLHEYLFSKVDQKEEFVIRLLQDELKKALAETQINMIKSHGNITFKNILSVTVDNYFYFDESLPSDSEGDLGTSFPEVVVKNAAMMNTGRYYHSTTPFYHTEHIEYIPEVVPNRWNKQNIQVDENLLRLNSFYRPDQQAELDDIFKKSMEPLLNDTTLQETDTGRKILTVGENMRKFRENFYS